jgi:hypothetical protein
MNVAPLRGSIRVAFLAPPELEPHFPASCRWAAARFVPSSPERAAAAIDDAVGFGPDVAIVADPHRLPGDELWRLPGVRVGVVTGPLAGEELARLKARGDREPGGQGFDFFTWFEDPPPEAAGLPILQVLPLVVDTERCLPAPRLEQRRVLVPAWARPPAACLARIRAVAAVTEIPAEAATSAWPQGLGSAGALVYWSRATLGRLDPLPLLALANGLLVVASSAFPERWGIEREDEYLVRPDEDGMAQAIEEGARTHLMTRAIRVRAWQKVRESFSADGAYHRLVHDALLLTRGTVASSTREAREEGRRAQAAPRAARDDAVERSA